MTDKYSDMPAMIRANDKIEREREVRGEIHAIREASLFDDPLFYFTKAQLRKAFPDAILIEATHRQVIVVDCDMTVHTI